MPTYEYLCKTCGERFEKVQPFSARPLRKHESCGGELQKVFHPSGVVFKGTGFYATDNRPAAKTASIESDSKSDSTSNSKPAAKSDRPKKEAPKKEAPAAAAAD
jgi:putative FmdB family regulatory protein